MTAQDLAKKGFDNAQINQILKINEYGLDLSGIDVYTPIDILRKIRKDIKDINIITTTQLQYARDLVSNNHNPIEILFGLEGRNSYFISTCYRLLEMDYDISKLKLLPCTTFQEIADCIMDGCKVSLKCLEDPELSLPLIKKALNAANQGIEIEEYFGKNFSEDRIMEILNVKIKDSTIDVSPLSDTSFNDEQASVLAEALIKKLNLTAYCNNTFDANQMKQILIGLSNQVDVTIYNKKRYTGEQMEVILAALCHNKYCEQYEEDEDCVDVDKLLNSDYESALMDFIFMCQKEKVDTEIIENKGYNFAQALLIIKGREEGIDVSIYSAPSNSAEEMRTIKNAINLSDKYDVDMNFILDKTVSTNSKIKYLIDLISTSYKDVNLNAEFSFDEILEGITVPLMEINDYYYENDYCYYDEGDIIYKAKTDNDCIIEVNYNSLFEPDITINTTDEEDIGEKLVSIYRNELEELAEIISFIGYDRDKGYFVKNLVTGETTYISSDEIGESFDEICDLYQYIIESSIEAIEYDSSDNFSVFYSFETLADSFGPDVAKVLLSYEMNSTDITAYIFAKELHDKFGDLSNKEYHEIFERDLEKMYAYYMEDTYEAIIYDKDNNIIDRNHIYGSRKLEETLEELFNVKIVEFENLKEEPEEDIDFDIDK